MKLVYYTDQIYLHGGIERVIANKLNYLSKNTNIELHLITVQQKYKLPCYSINNKVKFHDLNVNYNRDKSLFHPINFLKVPKHYLKLKQKIKELKPDIIVVCNYEYGFYFIPLISKDIFIIKEYHSSKYFKYTYLRQNKSNLKNILNQIFNFFENKYSSIILLTKDELEYYHSNNKIVIPNAYSIIQDKKAKLDSKRVISAGRIAPVKGFDKLIETWKIIAKECPDWHLDIYGDGELDYIAHLNEQIIDSGLQDKILLHNATTDLDSKIIQSSIYAMSSRTECFPMVLLEAMNLGVPVVSFDCPNGPRNIIKHGEDGLLVENNDINALAMGILTLIKNPEDRKLLGANAQKNIQRFNEENIMTQWLRLFRYEDSYNRI